MDELIEILIELEGEPFLNVFIESGLTKESLKLLKPSHLDTLIDTSQFGPRVIFEHNLLNWQAQQGIKTQAIHTEACALLANEYRGEESFEAILSKSVGGSQILKYYAQKKCLTPKYRKFLAATVANYFISAEVHPNPKTFEAFANKIVDLFTSESKDIYYIHKKGKKPGGSLYAKYHSVLLKLRRDGLISKRDVEPTTKGTEINSCVTDCIQEKSWLKYNVEPFDEVQLKWEATFAVRRQMLQKDANLNTILEVWPQYKQSFGHLMIELDFKKLYPEKQNLLFDKWESFCQAIPPLLEIYIKDSNSLTTWRQFKEGSINADAKDLVIFYLLHSVLIPTGRTYRTCKQTKKKHFIMYTIADSRNSFLLWAPTSSELQSKLKLMVDANYMDKSTIQPIICPIGLDYCKEYYVYFADIFYKFDNLIKCIDVCFKTFHVLNLEYPPEFVPENVNGCTLSVLDQ
ncbi:uncharacterized protein LOC129248779 [Anastrepha obliqua]|uniref:uncharacterized protein LOC129248779 n=1 Tax=Anastrepha obliqua TaxID=95512 RepID=UPI002409DF7F|nr:uncharacterized protein LOC129248779 [Anastrepha obliqua]